VWLGRVGRRLGSQRIERQRNGERDGGGAAAQSRMPGMTHRMLRVESIAEAWRAERSSTIGRAPEPS
jgi:hypothetical protein